MAKRKPIFIIYSDIHHHIYAQYNEDNKRLKTSLDIEESLFLEAKNLGIPIIFTGDILHNDELIQNELFEHILPHYVKLNKLNVTWYGIDGNHDQSDINTFEKRSSNYIKTLCSAFDNFVYMSFESDIIEAGNKYIGLHGIPYISHDKDLYKIVKSIKRYKGIPNILLLHTTLPMAKDTNGRIIQTTTIDKKFMKMISRRFDLTLTGHIHKPMKLGDNIYQIGATNQQRKTDKDCEMGYWIMYDDLKMKFIPIDSPKFIELKEGEKAKNKEDYYYNKVEKNEEDVIQDTKEYSDTTNTKLIVKSYLKQKGIKDKNKRRLLIKLLKNEDDDII
jgi:DNA repair exonuclease SbcCD nuclease subunit